MDDPSASRQRSETEGPAAPPARWGWLQPWRKGGGTQIVPLSTPDRRAGGERRSTPSQEGQRLEETRRQSHRRQDHRRAHVRQPMPFGGVAPSGRICCEPHGCVHADLIDVSEGGSCVLLSSPMPLQLGDRLALTLHENFGTGTLQVELEVRWLVETPMGLRVGGRFLDPEFRPSTTFLKTYLEADFGSHRRSDH